MEERVRWVSKSEAAAALDISPSTLDRMIRRGELEVTREGRRVYVRLEGPDHPGDEELPRRSGAREEELQRTVRELEESLSEWQVRASELERERDEARESATASRPYVVLEREYRNEVVAHRKTKQTVTAARAISIMLFVLLVGVVLVWWFVLR